MWGGTAQAASGAVQDLASPGHRQCGGGDVDATGRAVVAGLGVIVGVVGLLVAMLAALEQGPGAPAPAAPAVARVLDR